MSGRQHALATRSGTVDPGMVLWLAEQGNLSPAEMRRMLETRSGLLALSGTKDLPEVEAACLAGHPRAV